MIIEKNVILKNHTSWLIGGPADFFCLPQNQDEVMKALRFAKEQNLKVEILSGGSNVLISDKGVRGLVLGLKKLNTFVSIEKSQGNEKRLIVECDAGLSKSELLKVFLKKKLAPALFLAGIPGDVGGGVVMNAGVAEAMNPREFVEIVDWVEALHLETLQKKTFQKADLGWSYRHCAGLEHCLVLRVGVSWPLEIDPEILEKVRQANRVRLSKQPLDKPSCGSVFVNPPGHKAAQLIDSAGLKGFQIGDAQVSLKHANFIVNLGEATADDTWQVMKHVQAVVQKTHGIALQTEVRRLGDWSG